MPTSLSVFAIFTRIHINNVVRNRTEKTMNNAGQPWTSSRLVYLDWNIIISLADGRLPMLRAALAEAVDIRAIVVPFSATHVQEADHIADGGRAPEGLAESRLRFLSELTEDTYLYNAGDSYSPAIIRQSPEEVRQIVNEVPFAKPAMRGFVDMFGLSTMKGVRNELGLSPNDLNNIKPPGVIAQLDRAIAQKIAGRLPGLPSGFGVRQLLDTALKFYPNSEKLSIDNKIAAVFSGLNSFGFWPDNPKKTTSMAAFFDSMHAANATLCCYFVSEDKALRVKSMAVYELFGFETRVVDVNEITAIING